MSVRRVGSRFLVLVLICGWACLLIAGCSQQEELTPDPGASPFYPGPGAQPGRRIQADAAGDPPLGGSTASPTSDDQSGSSATAGKVAFDASDIERQMRVAMRRVQKNDLATAAQILDQVLVIQPTNREALMGRAALRSTRRGWRSAGGSRRARRTSGQADENTAPRL